MICAGATLNELATIDTPVVVGTCTVTVTGRFVIEPAWYTSSPPAVDA